MIHVGLPYTCDFQTLDIENPQGGSLADRKKRINRIALIVESSRGIFAGPDENHLTEYKQRSSEKYGETMELFTGVVKMNIAATWNDNGRIFIRQSDPLPISIQAVILTGRLSD